MLRVAFGACFAALALGGCDPAEGFGYVEIRSTALPGQQDVYRLNGAALAQASLGSGLVLRQKTGPVKLELTRNGAAWTLCTFNVGKNRVVTAVISMERGAIRCVVRA